MAQPNPVYQRQAERHFEEARQQARRERFWSWLFGRDNTLIPFEAIQAEIREIDPTKRSLRDIPLDKIVGSVGRYDEFTSEFLPLKDSLRDRWISVEAWAMEHGWPPIHVYQVGDCYFVVDGNHRVSVARQLGNDTIEAYVSEVPNSANIDTSQPLDALLIDLGARNFMAMTQLDRSVPDHDIFFTTPGNYQHLTEQIFRLRRQLEELDGEDLSLEDAAVAWYEMVFAPTALLIELSGLLDQFSGRTVADLFIWLFLNRHPLRDQYGDFDNWGDLLARIEDDFAARQQETTLFGRAKQMLRGILQPDAVAPLPDWTEL